MQLAMGTDKLPELQPDSRGAQHQDQDEQLTLPRSVTTVTQEELSQFVHTKRVGNYLLGRTIGEGAFAKVKEGLHVLTGEKVAVKVIDKRKTRDDVYVTKNLRREAKLLQMVRQDNIIQLLEVVETDNSYYLVTELCAGGELMDHICKHQHLREDEVRKYVRQIVHAIHHLHQAGIIHRDLKVENLLLDESMNLKIIDFGLSNVYGKPSLANGTIVPTDHCHTQCGSPAYAAPELLGHKNYGPEVDVWSIGINMYAMLTGSLPYTVEPFNLSVLHAKMLDNKMNPIPSRISASCRDLLLKLLIPKPEERIPLADVFQHPWLNEDLDAPFTPCDYPNLPTKRNVNKCILHYMTETLRFTEDETVAAIVSNRAVRSTAVYHLLLKRLQRHEKTHSKCKEFVFQRPQTQQAQKMKRKTSEQQPPERKISKDTKHETKPSTAGRRKRYVSQGETSPTNPVTMDKLIFPTRSRRQSAPVTPTLPDEKPFVFSDTYPASVGNSPVPSRPPSPPPSVTQLPQAGTRDRERAPSGNSRPKTLRRVQTAAGDLRREDIAEKKITPPKSDHKSSTLPHPRRLISQGMDKIPNFDSDFTSHDDKLFETRRPRTQSDTYARFRHSLRRNDTFHNDYRRDTKSPRQRRPLSLTIEPQTTHYQPNRMGSFNIANRAIKTNTFFHDNSDLSSPVDLPAISPPSVPTTSKSHKSHTNKPFYETSVSERNGLPWRFSRRGSDDSLPSLSDGVQRMGDVQEESLPQAAAVSEVIRVLETLGIDDLEQKGSSIIVARWGGVIFETQVTQTNRNGHHNLKFSRLTGGDQQRYKEICDRVKEAIREANSHPTLY